MGRVVDWNLKTMEAEAEELRFHRRQPKRSYEFTGVEEDEKEQLQQHKQSPCVKRTRLRTTIRGRETKTVTLPDDIIHGEILPRLPTKYILRCRLVCKSWYSSFSTSAFVNSHLIRRQNHTQEEEDLLIVKTSTTGGGIQIVSRTSAITVRSMPFIHDVLLGSINGLVALSSLDGEKFCLWNPAVAQLKFFPMPPSHSHPTTYRCKHFLGGFCWDHVRNDYKVLLFCYDSFTSIPSQLCIYSANSANWTTLPIPPAYSMLPAGPTLPNWTRLPNLFKPPCAIVKGIPYWSYQKYLHLPGKKRRRKFISTFKFLPQINEFRFLPDLDSLKPRKNSFHIVNIKDSLFGMAYNVRKESLVDIYSLDGEESQSGVWSKMYTVGPVDLSYGGRSLSQFFKNGGDILIYASGCPFAVYDTKTKETKFLESSDCGCFRTCFSYTPSLVCVPGMELMQESFTKKDGVELYFLKLWRESLGLKGPELVPLY